MLRAAILVPAMVMALGHVAVGQTPFVANHFVPQASWTGPVGPTAGFIDISGSEQTLDVPAGDVLITWSCSMTPDLQTRIRPKVGDSFPADGTIVNGGRSTGSWLTTSDGGSITVGLQVESVYSGSAMQIPSISSMSWSLVVVSNTAADVPAIGTIGMGIMVILLLGAGAYVLSKREQPAA